MAVGSAQAEAYTALAAELKEIDSLSGIDNILSWDELVIMKERSAASRAAQKAALASVIHQRQTSEKLGELIKSAEQESGLGPMEQASVRDARLSFDRKTKVIPPFRFVSPLSKLFSLTCFFPLLFSSLSLSLSLSKLPSELAKLQATLSSEGYQSWAKARASDDYETFKPVLAKIIQLRVDEAKAVAPEMLAYDYQIDKFERGMKASRLREIFDEVKAGLVPLIKEITSAKKLSVDSRLAGGDAAPTFEVSKQEALCSQVMEKLGFEGRLDKSLHPFTGGTASDVRITTRYDPKDFISGVAGLIHETGHALYEQNRPAGDNLGMPVSEALSMGIHESQSLLFERMIGQSEEFWTYFQPMVADTFEFTKDLSKEDFYAAINKVEKNLIRVDADELTYPLHIIIRFELEQGLFDGSITVDNLPAKWNELYASYLGIDVPSDKEGCLQDVHWGSLAFGYFPSYTLGAMYACQFFQHAEKSIPGLRAEIAEGNFTNLRQWLNDNIHSKVRPFTSSPCIIAFPFSTPPSLTSFPLSFIRARCILAQMSCARPSRERSWTRASSWTISGRSIGSFTSSNNP